MVLGVVRAVVGGDVVDSAGFANFQLISFSLGSKSYHFVCFLENLFVARNHLDRQSVAGFPPEGSY